MSREAIVEKLNEDQRRWVDDLFRENEKLRDALDRGRRFERAYQESLGATPTPAQWDRLESLQSAFLDAYLEVLS